MLLSSSGLLFEDNIKIFCMKKIILLFTTFLLIAGAGFSQKDKTKQNGEKTKVKDDKVKIKDASGNKTKWKAPEPVAKAFMSDYPDIKDVTWSKSKGDWAATYNVNGLQTVATYHANGDEISRVETRTWYPVAQAPQPVIIYQQANPTIKLGKIAMITVPSKPTVYELRSSTGQVVFIDENGNIVTYTP
jgi:hypothetical protein